MSVTTQADEIRVTFAFLDDWEARYEHIIDLGKSLPALDASDMQDIYKVPGCASQVWIVPEDDSSAERVHFRAGSDAILVSGLIALLSELFNNQAGKDILAFDAPAFFAEIGLTEALSAQRANGLRSMLARIQNLARAQAS